MHCIVPPPSSVCATVGTILLGLGGGGKMLSHDMLAQEEGSLLYRVRLFSPSFSQHKCALQPHLSPTCCLWVCVSVPTFVFHSFFPYHPSSVVHFQCGFKGGVGIQAADTFIPLALPHYTPAEIPSAFLLPLQHVDLELAHNKHILLWVPQRCAFCIHIAFPAHTARTETSADFLPCLRLLFLPAIADLLHAIPESPHVCLTLA